MIDYIREHKEDIWKNGQIYDGNLWPIKDFLNRAKAGEPLTVSFIGGSITQGCTTSQESNQYVHRVFDWLQARYPQSKMTFLRAAVGGTNSQYGSARIQRQVLDQKPDFLLVEFAVNDSADDFHKETYEGLMRHILTAEKVPALMGHMNVVYNTGVNAQEQHLEVLHHYEIPAVSMKNSFYAEIEKGHLTSEEMSADHLHPNDFGHEMLAGLVCSFLQRVDETDIAQKPRMEIPAPLTMNRYQNIQWILNDCKECDIQMNGFTADENSVFSNDYYFANGWTASHVGDSITFTVQAASLSVQYRKVTGREAVCAEVIVDGDEANATFLDAHFEETWGDCLFIQNLTYGQEVAEHTVTVRVTQAPENAAEFYLLSVFAAQ